MVREHRWAKEHLEVRSGDGMGGPRRVVGARQMAPSNDFGSAGFVEPAAEPGARGSKSGSGSDPTSSSREALPNSRKPVLEVPPGFQEDPLKFLSTASPESLAALPGIGPVIAERIASAASGKRPFTRWEELLSVKGIGPKKLEVLKRIAKVR